MRFLHTMIRVGDLDRALAFFCGALGLQEVRRTQNEKARYTLVYLAAPEDAAQAKENGAPMIELTHNWDEDAYAGGRNFGHIAFAVENIYEACARLQAAGVTINRPPRDGHMAFVRTPDLISIELLQKGAPLPPTEPWASAPNIGAW
ncbi:VOC family protein [Methylocystis hirsuta]|jgi:lactoylglutathione lyase|uniref:Lactoylglutathione lyase n=1 Tax=Methylocystis hirsuta TaxID=369798 RepID=A0A3M9XN61_9HYPH|nr:VOC family protein [Methylocystis hirsuta]RNJ49172.1 lactoylglutathione lyase [Methylocystis hirsuta]